MCTLTSEIFYDGRLEPEAQNARQRLGGTPPLAGSGLRHGPVAHRGMDVLNSGNRFNVAVSRALAQASPEDDRELTHA